MEAETIDWKVVATGVVLQDASKETCEGTVQLSFLSYKKLVKLNCPILEELSSKGGG